MLKQSGMKVPPCELVCITKKKQNHLFLKYLLKNHAAFGVESILNNLMVFQN